MKKYYVLRFENSDSLHKAGDQVFNADATLRIGQQEGCEVLLANETQYEDAVLAVIIRNDDGEGWRIIRTSSYREHAVRVNGTEVDYVQHLSDGDRIAFEGSKQELLFNVRSDDEYNGSKPVVVPHTFPKWLIATLVLLPLVLFGVGYGIMSHNMEKKMLTEEMIKKSENSVVQIKTDSVFLLAYNKTTGDTLHIDSCEYMVSGTAFITDDSLLVTARHCVEPWLNVDSIPADSSKIESLPVKWALMAETRNQEEIDSIEWMVVSRLSVVIPDSTGSFIIEKFSSTDLNIEKSRDHVIEYGDFDHLYFWRSIAALPRRTDMMLDDFAFLRLPAHLASHAEGAIHLASKEEILQLEKRKPVTILGFPESGVGAADFESSTDELRHLPTQDSLGFPDGVLHHNGEIAHGYSGGPVLVRNGNECYAVGIISVHDRLNKNRTLSVPVSEVERWKLKQNNTK